MYATIHNTAQHNTQLYYTILRAVCIVCVSRSFLSFHSVDYVKVYTSLSSFAHFAPLFPPPTHISSKQLLCIPSASCFFLHSTVDTVLLFLWLLLLLLLYFDLLFFWSLCLENHLTHSRVSSVLIFFVLNC